MKRLLLALVLASSRVACPAAQTPPQSATVNGSAKGDLSGELEAFKTEGEAVEHFQKALEASKANSMNAIYSAFGITLDASERNEEFTKMAPMMRLFTTQSGSLVKVDRCLGPKLGDSILRAGYILLYEHGFGFVDAALFHTKEGWRVLNLHLNFNSDTDEMIKAIPAEYYLGGQTPAVAAAAGKTPAPTPTLKPASEPLPDWSAFSLVEPDENGGCTETVYLVNEHGAPTKFDGNLVVNPGETVRFVHIVADDYKKHLTHSFPIPGHAPVPVKSVVVKGMSPYPEGN